MHSSTYSGDNYPDHFQHDPTPQVLKNSAIDRSINALAYALGEQEAIIKLLHERLARTLIPSDPFPSPKDGSCEDLQGSAIRNDIDGQASRVRQTNLALNELLDRLEL